MKIKLLNKNSILLAVIAVVILVAVIFTARSHKTAEIKNTEIPVGNSALTTTSVIPAVRGDFASTNSVTSTDKQEGKIYKHINPNFSFYYPDTYVAGEKVDGKKYTVVARDANDASKAFQMAVAPFGEQNLTLTPERLHHDVPSMAIMNAQLLELTGGVKTLAFQSIDPLLGRTQEIWFVKDGYLYQISAPVTEREALTKLLVSIVWSK